MSTVGDVGRAEGMRGASLRVDRVVLGRTGLVAGGVGIRLRRRYAFAFAGCLVALALVTLVAATAGTLWIPLDRVFDVVAGGGDRVDRIVVGRRLARETTGLVVGFALGMAGGITQSITRNPLASPDILGVTSGASVFAVIAFVVPLPGLAGIVSVPLAALVGGLVVTAIVVALASRGGLDPLRLVLVGVGITAICGALTQWLLMVADVEWAAVAMRWLAGSLGSSSWTDVLMVLPVCVGAIVVTAIVAPGLAALRLGPDQARSLGVRVGATQGVLLFVAVALVAVAIAAAGPIGFVAFVAPQIAMRLFGTPGPPVLAAGVLGAVLVTAADLVAHHLPVELPVGVVTSIFGGIVLLVLLVRIIREARA
ncbi:FecCD family ABC transporter permease [Microbacterium sp. bgisy203]|uniref:FecCD family ABC transporter permease n=1 Tax=Microbacterium sp. bgisy203 TaxID=3413799 RepID=UPI003D749E27